MRIRSNETYEDWVERVRAFELDRARKQLAKGIDTKEVLESMSERISKKILHPILTDLKDTPRSFDLAANKKAYEEAYLRKNSPKPDHVSED
jgi:glutamyl-tRNA reductase